MPCSGRVEQTGAPPTTFTLAVAGPATFTLTTVDAASGASRTMLGRKIEPPRTFLNKILLGVMVVALIGSQIWIKRKVRERSRAGMEREPVAGPAAPKTAAVPRPSRGKTKVT